MGKALRGELILMPVGKKWQPAMFKPLCREFNTSTKNIYKILKRMVANGEIKHEGRSVNPRGGGIDLAWYSVIKIDTAKPFTVMERKIPVVQPKIEGTGSWGVILGAQRIEHRAVLGRSRVHIAE